MINQQPCENVTQKMLEAAMVKAVDTGLIPKYASENDYIRNWQAMAKCIAAAIAEMEDRP